MLKKYLRIIPGVLICGGLFFLTACGKGGGDSRYNESAKVAKDDQGNDIVLDVPQLPLNQLTNAANPYVKQQSITALNALKDRNYADGMRALMAISSLKLDAQQAQALNSTLQEVMRVVEPTAAAGDKNAQYALDYFKQVTAPPAQ